MTPELIKKYQDAAQEYVDLIKKSKGKLLAKDVKALQRKHGVSSTTSTDILRVNIVKRVGRGLYQVNVDKIEPIHSRRIIESRRKYIAQLSKKRFPKKFKEDYKPFADTPLIEVPKKERSISVLWGLFKIKY